MTDLTIYLYDHVTLKSVRDIISHINGCRNDIMADADLYGRIHVSGVRPGDVPRVIDRVRSRNGEHINKIELNGVRV